MFAFHGRTAITNETGLVLFRLRNFDLLRRHIADGPAIPAGGGGIS